MPGTGYTAAGYGGSKSIARSFTIVASDLWGQSYTKPFSGQTGVPFNPYSFSRWRTDASAITITYTSVTAAGLCVYVNGTYLQTIATPMSSSATISLPAGENIVDIWHGGATSTTNGADRVTSVSTSSASIFELVPPNRKLRSAILVGDSIFNGFAPLPTYSAVILRAGLDMSVTFFGGGGDSLYAETANGTDAGVLVQNICEAAHTDSIVLIEYSHNDYAAVNGSNTGYWSAASFQNMLSQVVDGVLSRRGDIRIALMTMPLTTTSVTNNFGNVAADYRSATTAVANGRFGVVLLDGTQAFSLVNTLDGVHPNVAGNAQEAAFLNAAIQPGGTADTLRPSLSPVNTPNTRFNLALSRAGAALKLTPAEQARAQILDLSKDVQLLELGSGGAGSIDAPYGTGGFWHSVAGGVSGAYSSRFEYSAFELSTCTKWYVEADAWQAGMTLNGQIACIGFLNNASAPGVGIGFRWSTAHSAMYIGAVGCSDPIDLIPADGNNHSLGVWRNGATSGFSTDLINWTLPGSAEGFDSSFASNVYCCAGVWNTTTSAFNLLWRNLFCVIVPPA